MRTESRTAVSAPCGSLKVTYATCDRSLLLKGKGNKKKKETKANKKPIPDNVCRISEHHYTGTSTWLEDRSSFNNYHHFSSYPYSTKEPIVITNLCISTCSMSPENEKNSLISCSDASKETLPTFTDWICKEYNNLYNPK